MTDAPTVKPGRYFMQGNEACVEGAVAAGCSFFAGYPITPSTEILEGMSKRMPERGGVFIQMEDELASLAAAVGASWTGRKAMTATSGPGFSLMQENIGYAAMTETPVVVVNVQRVGPSTGLPTKAAQGDVMQARWGSHGDYDIVVLAPGSVGELFTQTVEAFNISEEYRTPVVVLSDAELAHMRGTVTVPGDLRVAERKRLRPGDTPFPFESASDAAPPFPTFGAGHSVHVTGLSHNIMGYPLSDEAEVHSRLVRRISEKINTHRDSIAKAEVVRPGSKIMLVAFGTTSLTAREVVRRMPEAGLFRPQTLWPFPTKLFREAVKGSKRIVVLEMNRGQFVREVERHAGRLGFHSVEFFPKLGGEVHLPGEVVAWLAAGGSSGV